MLQSKNAFARTSKVAKIHGDQTAASSTASAAASAASGNVGEPLVKINASAAAATAAATPAATPATATMGRGCMAQRVRKQVVVKKRRQVVELVLVMVMGVMVKRH
jgi:hypothetical protein